MPKINNEILVWARETAGFSLTDAAKKLGFKDSEKTTAESKLAAYEEGIKEPSRSLLGKMAKHYKRPLITFYMSQAPRKGDRGEDFRTLPETYDPLQDANVDALIRNVRARQKLVRELLEEDQDAEKVPFVDALTMKDGVDRVAQLISEELNFDLSAFRDRRNYSDAFSYARTCAESAGIFIMLIGNLGSHHTKIDLKSFRGFALADDLAPFIVINDNDHKGAWSFTLFHELAHIVLGKSGISNLASTRKIEKFCNEVAARILLPIKDLDALHLENADNFAEVKLAINDYAERYNVSNTMLSYNVFLAGRINQDVWNQLRGIFKRDFQRAKEAPKKGAPDYYVVRRHRIGNALIAFVGQSLQMGEITSVKAAKVLGVKPQNLEKLIRPSIEHGFAG